LTDQKLFKPNLERIKSTLLTHYWDFKVTEAPNGVVVLSQVLRELFLTKGSDYKQEYWIKQLGLGSVFINGKVEKRDLQRLIFPIRIEFYEPRYNPDEIEKIFPAFSEEAILFEDKHLLLYLKPFGLPCVPAREQTKYNLRSYLDSYVGKPIHMPSRLDMSTMGIVPVSKTKLAHNSLQQVFQTRRVQKRYRLLTDKIPEWSKITAINHITKHPDHPVLRTCIPNERTDSDPNNFFRKKVVEAKYLALKAKEAITHFSLLKKSNNQALLEAKPVTGRTHQIRVQAQFLDLPIVGDNFYNGLEAKNLHLICYSLSFPHPIDNTPFNCKIPDALLPDWAKI
jgi:23S rRNA-/tRNA-specific pseudouridylate synthase